MNGALLITRPQPDAEATAHYFQARGHMTLCAPMVTIVPNLDAQPRVSEMLARKPVVVTTSRHAIYALKAADAAADVPLWVVGEESAERAEALGFTQVRMAAGNAASLLEQLAAHASHHTQMVYLRGRHVRLELAAKLYESDFDVEEIVVYDAQAATRLTEETARALREGTLAAVCFFSARTAQIFSELVAREQLTPALSRLSAFAFSEATAEGLDKAAWAAIEIASQPTLASMLAAVDNAGRHAA